MTLIAIGGAEDKQGAMDVLKAVLAEASGAQSKVVVVTSATSYPDDARKTYIDAFKQLGVDCEVAHIENKAQADTPALLSGIAGADVVFFSGGDQSKLVAALEGTDFMQAVLQRHREGGIVAGTSAGAAAMSALMVTGGNPERATEPGEITSARGFGLAPEIIFDTHFLNRGRLPRLFNLVAAHPQKTGIGLDEDTAAIMRGDGSIEAVGSGAVPIVRQGAERDDFSVTTLKRGDVFRL